MLKISKQPPIEGNSKEEKHNKTGKIPVFVLSVAARL
jgi:hypothetical protein